MLFVVHPTNATTVIINRICFTLATLDKTTRSAELLMRLPHGGGSFSLASNFQTLLNVLTEALDRETDSPVTDRADLEKAPRPTH